MRERERERQKETEKGILSRHANNKNNKAHVCGSLPCTCMQTHINTELV